jgi:hypothetical protein
MRPLLYDGRKVIFTGLKPIIFSIGIVPAALPRKAICNYAQRPTFRRKGSEPWTYQYASRGAKTKSTTKLKDLPQGALKLESYDDGSDDVPRYPTVVQGHRNNVEKFKNCVVLTRVGGFYEV